MKETNEGQSIKAEPKTNKTKEKKIPNKQIDNKINSFEDQRTTKNEALKKFDKTEKEI